MQNYRYTALGMRTGRERERMQHREELWQRIEARAAAAPEHRPHLRPDSAALQEPDLSRHSVERAAHEARRAAILRAPPPLLRKKSELPQDSATAKSLAEHRRTDDCSAVVPAPTAASSDRC
ncbi:hypothetical protein EVAR_42869_1 [Eumeta japonica]|uniref:Uncharacterized protein n=1 Tax=Eumeta variegata TaxID=151549 RepID=A0A4C1YGW1_EUMVA|nr:hypothetical protein EVAR_42869_1 [Eumeta japonica]